VKLYNSQTRLNHGERFFCFLFSAFGGTSAGVFGILLLKNDFFEGLLIFY